MAAVSEQAAGTTEGSGPSKVLGPSEVVLHVAAGSLPNLLGARETDQVDFKAIPYDLNSNQAKQDLAADVAMLANARGGVLVLGVRTTVHTTERVEVASRLDGCGVGVVNAEAYRKLVEARVVPLVREVRFYAGPLPGRNDLELVVIEVAAQREHDKPFLVDRLVSDEGHKLTHAVGWPERSGDGTFWHPKERIQQLIAAGLRSGQNDGPDSADEEPREEQVAAWTGAGVGESTPRFAIQLVPVAASAAFDEFYGADLSALRLWRPVRATGFGFDLGWHQPLPQGTRIVAVDQDTALLINRKGIVTLVSAFETRTMTWGGRPDDPRAILLNSFAVTEIVAETVRLAYEFVGARLRPERWRLTALARDMKTEKVVTLDPPRQFSFVNFPATVSDDEFEIEGRGGWESDAYRLLGEIYGRWFGRPESSIWGADQAAKAIDLPSLDRFR